MELSRERYIESEYKKWEERFEIPFEKEFDVRALLSLQHQFLTLPEEHVKTKADVILTINKLTERLDLKRKTVIKDEDKLKVTFVVNDQRQLVDLEDILTSSMKDTTKNVLRHNPSSTTIKTEQYNIRIHVNNNDLRGQRSDFAYRVAPIRMTEPEHWQDRI